MAASDEEGMMGEREPYAVRLEGRLEPGLSRWLWLVKWLLAIPHYVVLVFLSIAFLVLTIVAFFAILFTSRYPRGIFDFNVGVLRWGWRVGFYSYAALGTDRYPPFTLGPAPDYPATLEVDYPAELSRGLVLVKWWLLAIPHYCIVGIFVGGGGYAASRVGDWMWGPGWFGGLIGLLVLFAGVALLFTTRYPRGIFDVVLGLDRWVARVTAYAGLMTDRYPPFRLDQGGAELPADVHAAEVTTPSQQPAAAEAATPAGSRAGRIALLVLGGIAAFLAFLLLVSGCALGAVDRTQRDDDGFVMTPSEDFATPTYAIVSETAELDLEGAERAVQGFLGTVRIRSESVRPVFVGIARETEVARYLNGVEHAVVTDIEDEPEYRVRQGTAPDRPPRDAILWEVSAEGSGEQTLDWEPEDGNWRIVVMNVDATRGVAAELRIGAELDSVIWIAVGLLIAGGLLAAGAALAITAGIRRGRR